MYFGGPSTAKNATADLLIRDARAPPGFTATRCIHVCVCVSGCSGATDFFVGHDGKVHQILLLFARIRNFANDSLVVWWTFMFESSLFISPVHCGRCVSSDKCIYWAIRDLLMQLLSGDSFGHELARNGACSQIFPNQKVILS